MTNNDNRNINNQEMPVPEIRGEGFVSSDPVEYGAGMPKNAMDILAEELESSLRGPEQADSGPAQPVASEAAGGTAETAGLGNDGVASPILDPVEEFKKMVRNVLGDRRPLDFLDKKDIRNVLERVLSEESTVKGVAAVSAPTAVPVVPEKVVGADPGITHNPVPTKPQKPPFDASVAQPALKDGDREGGVAMGKTSGQVMAFKASEDDELIKSLPDAENASVTGKYEVGGFVVEYESKKGVVRSANIHDYFFDLETAKASVNGDRYLMPIGGGYRLAKIISGMPTISFNERQVYVYKDEVWVRG